MKNIRTKFVILTLFCFFVTSCNKKTEILQSTDLSQTDSTYNRTKKATQFVAGLGYLIYALPVSTFNRVFYTNDYCESKIDVTPIAELSAEQIDKLEEAIKSLENHDYIRNFRNAFRNEKSSDWYYSFYWYDNDGLRQGLNVYVRFYKEKQGAINRFKFDENRKEKKFTLIRNNNDTDAILSYSCMMRGSAEELYAPSSVRQINTTLRIGNAIINLSERKDKNQLDTEKSSKFIKFLCDLLNNNTPPSSNFL